MKKLTIGCLLCLTALLPTMMFAGIAPGFDYLYFNPSNTAFNVASGAPADTFGRCDDCYLDTPLALTSFGFSGPINFEGFQFSNVYVNNNGNITFTQPLSIFTPFPLVGNGFPIIAPYFGDVDTRGAPPNDPSQPNNVGVTGWGTANFTEPNGQGTHPGFGVTYNMVGYFNSHEDKLNTFQVLLIDRSDTGAGNFDIVFLYDGIQWETGDASGGSGGLGGTSARVGFTNGSTFAFELPGSGVNGALLDGGPDSLTGHTTNCGGELGCYIFNVRNGIVGTTPEPGSFLLFGSGLIGVAQMLRRRKKS